MSGARDGEESTRQAVSRLLAERRTQAQIAVELGVSGATVCHHARALGYPADVRFARRYDWSEVQAYYDLGHSVLRVPGAVWIREAVVERRREARRGAVIPRPQATPLDELLVAGRARRAGTSSAG